MKVAIIGAGIVGSAAAYYLSKEEGITAVIFDEGKGQATKAAAGIISPWFSKRRNKAWYKMARLGADFYQELIADLKAEGISTDFYEQSGVALLKKDETKLKDLYDHASKRLKESPIIGQISIEPAVNLSDFTGFEHYLFAAGGARVEGSHLTQTLIEAAGFPVFKEKAELTVAADGNYCVQGQPFDALILACGAWLPDILEPLGYRVDIRPQKGQLRDYEYNHLNTGDYPVLMPEGELDVIPFAGGKISVGASHENDKGYDLTVDSEVLNRLETEALAYFPKLKEAKAHSERVGTRAYTSDFSPFYGEVPGLAHVWAASGLGSSGLTTGPLIGCELVRNLLGQETVLNKENYPIERYIYKD
ncbi:NAD(P)/FAD-dependent oxidoreductase [Streptococcus dentiloxodontae]